MIQHDLFKIATYNEVSKILENISDSIVIIDPSDNRVIYCNKATYESLGYTKEEFSMVNSDFFTRLYDENILLNTYQQVLSGKIISFTSKHLKKDGTFQYADITLNPIIISNQTLICGIWNDITHNVDISRTNMIKNKRLSGFLEILSFLNSSQEFQTLDVEKYAILATPLISRALDIDRVSFRLYNADNTELVSISLYDRNNKDRIKAKTLLRSNYPDFFKYMESNPIIVVDDIRKNSSFEKMIKVFFSKDGMINSILITQIKVNTKIHGYLILQSKSTTSWDKEYVLFASQIADQVGIMLIEKEIKEHKEMLEKKVVIRTKALEQAKNVAENAVISKTQFLSNMSHEIRTPLNAIIGFLSLIDLEKIDEKNRVYIDQIKEGSNNLLEIINDVLDISKVEAGKIEPHYEFIDLKNFFEKKGNFYRSLFINRKISFTIDYDCKHLFYFVDENLLSIIMNNLLSNAFKYTKKGNVDLRVKELFLTEDQSHIMIEVEDTGIGIQQRDFSKIFNTFEQIEQTQQFSYKGSGLGLALTKQIVELLQGKITFQSTYQKGSTFNVILPLKFQNSEQLTLSALNDMNTYRTYSFLNKRILLVDDNHINQSMIINFLQGTEAEIDIASNGYDAIKMIESKSYHLVFMDLHMPGINGMITTELIRLSPKHQTIPIIALTADAYQRFKKDNNDELFDDFLLKPVQKYMIQKTLNKFIDSKRVINYENKTKSWLNHMEKLASLAVKDGLYYVSENKDLYETIIREFIKDHQHDFDQLFNVYDENPSLAYRIVHSLKSLLKTIGLNDLYESVIDIENMMIQKQPSDHILDVIKKTKINYNNQLFLMKYINQIHEIKETLNHEV